MEITCHHCGLKAEKPSGAINRSLNAGLKLFCSRVCFGLSRRKGKTAEQKKAEKAAYDQEYRKRRTP
jgi:hypothetical protein